MSNSLNYLKKQPLLLKSEILSRAMGAAVVALEVAARLQP